MAENCYCRLFYFLLALGAVTMILLFSGEPELVVRPADKTITQVLIFFQHGHRSPLATFPTDDKKYNNTKYWPHGPGYLTMRGMKAMHKLGVKLGLRYHRLIPKGYDPSRVHAESTSAVRTQQSAQLVLAGMFPPQPRDKWSSELLWQPIPVWTSRVPYVKVKDAWSVCPRFDQEYHRLTTDSIINFTQIDDPMIEFLEQKSGLRMIDPCAFHDLMDPFSCQVYEGYLVPNWARGLYPHKMTKYHDECYKIQAFKSSLQLQLGASPWLSEIQHQIWEAVLNKSDSTDVRLYSGDDFIVSYILTAFGFQFFIPKPGACIALELHHSTHNDYFIEFHYYEDDTVVDPYLMDLPGCRNPCLLNDFTNFIRGFVPEDYEAACQPQH